MSKCANRCPEIIPESDPVDQARRRLLAGAAAMSAVALAPGVMLYSAGSAEARKLGTAASSKVRWGILIDVSQCPDGCTECVTACKTENGWEGKGPAGTNPEWIRNVALKDKKTGAAKSVPMMCQHCEEPPCVDVCPTGASFKRADGIVLVDKHICIGCRYCMMACPFAARSFVHEPASNQKPHAPRGKGTVEACTMCVHRVDADGTPACVEACNKADNRSMTFGDLNNPNSDIAKAVGRHLATRIRADLGLGQGVLYTGL
ncbi:MAG: 4Fe-4S dicluster domain-containing protein [Rhodospirillales bacterium]|nr:4Fe-4S dicluster domain-containing protein [Rhodospirillales bacterium]